MTDREKFVEIASKIVVPYFAEFIADELVKCGAVIPIRCKECEEAEWDEECEMYLCRYHGCDYNKGEHFCSYGERREA